MGCGPGGGGPVCPGSRSKADKGAYLCAVSADFCDFTRDNAGPVWREVGERMGETLAHRGPDGKGLWQGADCVLVHRRLAVIDPERGQQPMARVRDGVEYVLIYNGELYNTDELRRELRKLGFSFETESDTEVLLNACIAWGMGRPNGWRASSPLLSGTGGGGG